MIYSIVVDEMMVEINVERLLWLVVGLLMLGVMFFFGWYFYIGVWKSFKNYFVNMDIFIVFGIGIVWFYLMLVVLVFEVVLLMVRYVYFEVIVMIIGLIDLGFVLELKVCGKILEVIKCLIGL